LEQVVVNGWLFFETLLFVFLLNINQLNDWSAHHFEEQSEGIGIA